MNRRDFLRSFFLIVAGWTVFKWLRPIEDISKDRKAAGLREAEFYRRADHLAG